MSDVSALHREEYGSAPDVMASAPGGVAVIGSYTEQSEGHVLTMAIDKRVSVSASRRTDSALRFFAAHLGERKRSLLATLKYKREDRWANVPKAVVSELARIGVELSGISITIQSEIPEIPGLGYGAATIAATIAACEQLFELELDPRLRLEIGIRAQERFLQEPTEIAGLITALHAERDGLLLVDTRLKKHHVVPLHFEDTLFVVTDSGVPPAPDSPEIAQRLRDCERSVPLLLAKRGGGTTLRDVRSEAVREPDGTLSERMRRRCLHVLEEGERVQEAVRFARQGDAARFGRVMSHSHVSQRDLFEISCPEIDWLVKRSTDTPGVYGTRLTGPGFGGCTVTLVRRASFDALTKRLRDYERIFGFHPIMWEAQAAAGAQLEVQV
jgi:galactokinase